MSEKRVIGREREKEILKRVVGSKEAEFVALYGRRRVGKTFLVRELLSDVGVYFEATGLKDGNTEEQLENFTASISKTFLDDIPLRTATNWKEAFKTLTKEIEKVPKSKKIILFFDELPWLATKRSGLLQALDYYWNSTWSRFENLKLIVCGSAASWILEKLINAKGGLYNRITKSIRLKPYNLKEAQYFLRENQVKLNHKQVLDIYMVFGGIPHYLKEVEPGKSAVQIINRVCFQKEGLLYSEFDRLFHSLFDDSEVHLSLIRAIAKKRYGISREELIKETGMSSGGTFNKKLEELEASEFIQSFVPYGRKKKDQFYRIKDEYVIFYLQWIEPFKKSGVTSGRSYWQTKSKTPEAKTWAGYTYENICLQHVDQIRDALDLNAVHCEMGSWRYSPVKGSENKGAQIDLLFDREDGVISLCEIKYSENLVTVDKAMARNLANKIEVFEHRTKTNKEIFVVIISVNGMKPSIWGEDLIQNEVVLKDLFKF